MRAVNSSVDPNSDKCIAVTFLPKSGTPGKDPMGSCALKLCARAQLARDTRTSSDRMIVVEFEVGRLSARERGGHHSVSSEISSSSADHVWDDLVK